MKIAALGRTAWLVDTIRLCAERGHETVLIGTCDPAPEYTVGPDDFSQLASELKVPMFCGAAINRPEFVQMARDSGAEVAISVNWLTMFKAPMLSAFPRGVINVHAGDLPRFRGNASPNWAILAGESRVVLTLHEMNAGLDAGDVLLQRSCPLTDTTYIGDVYRFFDQNIPSMFADCLDGLSQGTIVPRPQIAEPAASLRGFPRMPRDGQIDWTQSAESICRLVRASSEPFAGAYSYLNGEKIFVWRARPTTLDFPYLGAPGQVVQFDRKRGEASILAGEGVLVVTELETASRGRRPAADVLSSIRLRLGLDAGAEIDLLRERIARLETLLAVSEAGVADEDSRSLKRAS